MNGRDKISTAVNRQERAGALGVILLLEGLTLLALVAVVSAVRAGWIKGTPA